MQIVHSIIATIALSLRATVWLWTDGLHIATKNMSLVEKFAWTFLFINTIAALTVTELLLLGN